MSNLTVNISDFRCRGRMARSAHFAQAPSDRPFGLHVVETHREAERSGNSDPSCRVLDIGTASEAQRARNRWFAQPFSMYRKAKVLRFAPSAAMRAVRTMEIALPQQRCGDFDLPPAA